MTVDLEEIVFKLNKMFDGRDDFTLEEFDRAWDDIVSNAVDFVDRFAVDV